MLDFSICGCGSGSVVSVESDAVAFCVSVVLVASNPVALGDVGSGSISYFFTDSGPFSFLDLSHELF